MPDDYPDVHKALRALQECIQPTLDVLHSNHSLSRQEHLLIHEAISKLQVAVRYWETRNPR
jgi:hypothetical protein